jgi:hypothetical protein
MEWAYVEVASDVRLGGVDGGGDDVDPERHAGDGVGVVVDGHVVKAGGGGGVGDEVGTGAHVVDAHAGQGHSSGDADGGERDRELGRVTATTQRKEREKEREMSAYREIIGVRYEKNGEQRG